MSRLNGSRGGEEEEGETRRMERTSPAAMRLTTCSGSLAMALGAVTAASAGAAAIVRRRSPSPRATSATERAGQRGVRVCERQGVIRARAVLLC